MTDLEGPEYEAFSPLFIAVEVVTQRRRRPRRNLPPFSPLFIAVEVVTADIPPLNVSVVTFQSAFHRGRGCYDTTRRGLAMNHYLSVRFSSR